MTAEVTNGIKVSVETAYEPNRSNPVHQHYYFAYRITIENFSGTTVQLLRRQWFIFDSIGTKSEVEGEGVVGFQPILSPGESHQYISGCNLTSELGKMYGTYQMIDKTTKEKFDVKIPEFILIAPFKLN